MDIRVAGIGARVSECLSQIATRDEPNALYDPVRYVLAGGGKRLRPVLLLLCAEIYGVSEAHAMPAALAMEIAHNWTLVHDDIMDDSPTRRGRQTVHVRWGADTALLCGDALVGLAYAQLSKTHADPALFETFTRATLAVCEGQILDMQFETRSDVTMSEYIGMIDLKTGAFLGASLEMGAILGGATVSERAAARKTGIMLGRAFQIQDDLLDLVADDRRWGKIAGSDLVEGKKTFLLIEALNRAGDRDKKFFQRVGNGAPVSADDIVKARRCMDRLGVFARAREKVLRYTEHAVTYAQTLPGHHEALVSLMRAMAKRVH